MRFLAILFLVLSCNVATSQTDFTNQQLADQIRQLVKEEQQPQIDDLIKHLDDSRNTASALSAELVVAQADVRKIGDERDGWRSSYQKQAIELATSQKHTAYLVTALVILLVLNGAYAFAKFYLRVPFL